MIDGKISTKNEQFIVAQASEFANMQISNFDAMGIDCLAFIVNDLQGCSEYAIELWANHRFSCGSKNKGRDTALGS